MSLRILSMTTLLTLGVAVAASASELSDEPCINGGVSASGTRVSQSIEDTARYFADGIVYSTDPNYVFMIEGRIIAPAFLVQR